MAGYCLAPEEGESFDWHGARVVIKASADTTDGQLAVMESTYPPGLTVPAHRHPGEDEIFYVIAGELEGFCDAERWVARAGSFVFIPRGRPHGFVVDSAEAARAVIIVEPPHLDGQVAATGRRVPGAER